MKIEVKKYRKKPVMVEAVKYEPIFETEGNQLVGFDEILDDFFIFLEGNAIWNSDKGQLEIKTLEGNMVVSEGDYIIKGIENEFYPCKPNIFHKSYEEI